MAGADRDSDHSGLVPALLKHWRRQRGLSQLDLAVAADISARHVSFLETGRSVPSPEMVVLLGTTVGVPLRQINTMLRAAGHRALFDEVEAGDPLPASIVGAIEVLKSHHDPFPLVVMDAAYGVLDLNSGASALFALLLGDEGTVALSDLNLARLTFDPDGAQPFIANFDEVGRHLLWRIQREALADPEDAEIRELLDNLLAMPTVDPNWRQVDLSAPSDPALTVELHAGDVALRFLTTVTAFQAPQNVAVERLRIESWFPIDEATTEACCALACD